MKKIFLIIGTVLIALALAACNPKPAPNQSSAPPAGEETGELVIYSGRREQFIMPLIEKFTAETGIKVQLLSGSAAEYALKILDERNNPQADIFFANDAGVMEKLRLDGVLQPGDPAVFAAIPADFRAEDNSWVGLSARSRVFIYNKDLISEAEMPKSIFDLADSKWKGQFAITVPGSEAMISHLTAIRLLFGDKKTEEFIKGMLANKPAVLKGHTDIRKAVGAGEFKFGLVNNYYYHLQLLEDKDNNVGVIYPDQGSDQMGTFVNVAGVALVKGGRNPLSARKFVEFMLKPEQQEMFAILNYETPVLPGIPVHEIARPIDTYRRVDIKLSQLGAAWEGTIDLMEKAGYTQ